MRCFFFISLLLSVAFASTFSKTTIEVLKNISQKLSDEYAFKKDGMMPQTVSIDSNKPKDSSPPSSTEKGDFEELFTKNMHEYQAHELEWLLNFRIEMPYLFEKNDEITVKQVDLILTYQSVLDNFIKGLELANDKNTNGKDNDSYILRNAMQDFGLQNEIFDRKAHKDATSEWSSVSNSFKASREIVVCDPKSELNNDPKKIPLSKVQNAMKRRLFKTPNLNFLVESYSKVACDQGEKK